MITACYRCNGQGIRPNNAAPGTLVCDVCNGKCLAQTKFFAKNDLIVWRNSYLGLIVDDYSLSVHLTDGRDVQALADELALIGNIDNDYEARVLARACNLVPGKL